MEPTIEAVAEAASTNGASAASEKTLAVAGRLTNAFAETGLGFLGLSVAVVSTNYALKRFAEAWAQKG